MSVAVFHGTPREETELRLALHHACECTYDSDGLCNHVCSGHVGLLNDQRWLDRLLFYRSQAMLLTVEEFLEET